MKKKSENKVIRAIEYRRIRDINNFLLQEEDIFKQIAVGDFHSHAESESDSNRNKTLTIKEHLYKVKPCLKGIISNLKKSHTFHLKTLMKSLLCIRRATTQKS